MTKIAVTSPSFTKSNDLMTELQALGVQVVANTKGIDLEGRALVDFLQGAEIAIVGRETISDGVLAACPSLKCVAKYGVGLDNVDEAALKTRGVKLLVAPGTNRRAVAELVLAFALGHVRNVIPSINLMKEGRWVKNGGRDLSSLTVGIVGFGNTGTEVATLLRPFGCSVYFYDIVDRNSAGKELGARPATYADLLAKCDVVSFHVPATTKTANMLGPAELATMKSHALVINTSRGTVLDFDAVCDAVVENRLGAFAADVYPNEPYDVSTRPHPRLYFTPHIGGNSREAVLAMGRAALRGVAEYLKGT